VQENRLDIATSGRRLPAPRLPPGRYHWCGNIAEKAGPKIVGFLIKVRIDHLRAGFVKEWGDG
jgi:hypothetical protein